MMLNMMQWSTRNQCKYDSLAQTETRILSPDDMITTIVRLLSNILLIMRLKPDLFLRQVTSCENRFRLITTLQVEINCHFWTIGSGSGPKAAVYLYYCTTRILCQMLFRSLHRIRERHSSITTY